MCDASAPLPSRPPCPPPRTDGRPSTAEPRTPILQSSHSCDRGRSARRPYGERVIDPPRTTTLGRRAWTEIADDDQRPILAVPIGSCEQHGPHLPLDTDTRIAEAVAAGLATARQGILITPSLAITASGEHRGFPGTLSIGIAALQTMLIELARSADWSAGVIFVNGHGGNRTAVDAAARQLRDEGREVLSWWPRISGGDGHAGRTETSLMLAIQPALVRREAAVVGNTDSVTSLMPLLSSGGVAAASSNGVLGDPSAASSGEGDRLLAALIDDLIAMVDRVDGWRH